MAGKAVLEINDFAPQVVTCAKCRAKVGMLRGSVISNTFSGTMLVDQIGFRSITKGTNVPQLRLHVCRSEDLQAVAASRRVFKAVGPGPGKDGH